MGRFILQRVLTFIPILLIMSLVIFFIIQLPPGDYLTSYVAGLKAEGQIVDESELNSLKEVLNQKAKAIQPQWMDRYNTIRHHAFPPLARLNGSQCTGCNMSLPSGVVKDVESGKDVECETCGRLLIV